MGGGRQMNIFFRILLAIYAFCLAVFSALTMLMAVKADIYQSVFKAPVDAIFSSNTPGPRIAAFLIALVFFALSLMFLLSGVRSSKDKKAVSKYTNIGEVRISLNSIDNIATNASRKANGVKDTKTEVRNADDGVSIIVRAVVLPDISIPAISEDIQMRVKKSVEECSGIAVKDVKIIVDSIYSGMTYKSRVE
jgi:uncharacterized alkaline shock family protein YloU